MCQIVLICSCGAAAGTAIETEVETEIEAGIVIVIVIVIVPETAPKIVLMPLQRPRVEPGETINALRSEYIPPQRGRFNRLSVRRQFAP